MPVRFSSDVLPGDSVELEAKVAEILEQKRNNFSVMNIIYGNGDQRIKARHERKCQTC